MQSGKEIVKPSRGAPILGATATELWPMTQAGEALGGYLADLNEALASVEQRALEAVARRLEAALADDRAIYVAGNGGSAATASHWVHDLSQGSSRLRAFALCDNISGLTASANDHGVEQMFSAQLAPLLRTRDVLVVLSVSGNSPNLLHAVRWAQERGAATVGLLGWDGGQLRAACSDAVVLAAPFGEYGVVESGHTVICDVLARRMRAATSATMPVA